MRRRENPLEKLQLAWQRSAAGSALNKLNRSRKSIGKRPRKPNNRVSSISLPEIRLPKFLSFIKIPKIDLRRGLVLRILLIGVVIVAVTFFLRIAAAPMNPSSYAKSDESLVRIPGDTINILVVLYDVPENYPFVDLVGVLSVNKREEQNSISFINIDPEFSTSVYKKTQLKFRSLLANAEADQELGVDYLVPAVQNMLGVRLDRYMLVSKEKLAKFLQDTNLHYITTDSVSDPEAGDFLANKEIVGAQIVKYLSADAAGNEAKGTRIGKFLQTAIPKYLSLGGMLSSYFNLETVSTVFETNLTKQEIGELAVNLLNRGAVQYAYLSGQQYGRWVEARLGGYFAPDTIRIDDKVQSMLARSRVVREQGRIEIFNASNVTGLATATKRMLTNQGANIIRAGNSPERSERSKLYIEDVERFSANISLIREILRDDLLLVEEPYPLNHTGDMVLVLGDGKKEE